MASSLKPLFFLLVAGALYFSGSFLEEPGDDVVHYATDDANMNDAQEDARRSLPDFLAHKLDETGTAAEGAMVKVGFPITSEDGENDEVIWVGPFSKSGNTFTGALANDPVYIGGAYGDEVTFTQDMIRDWMYQGEDGKLYGNYTTRVMLPELTATQAAQISQLLSEDPMPARW